MHSREEEEKPSQLSEPYRPAADAAITDAVKPAQETQADNKPQKAIQLAPASIIPDEIHTLAAGCFYCFSSLETAQHQLSIIQAALKETHPDIHKASVKKTPHFHKTPYRFYLTTAQHVSLEKFKASDSLIKVIRWDAACFIEPFILGITRTPVSQYRQSLRSNTRGKFTVFASGVYPRQNKPARYSQEELLKKAVLSQHQSTSLITSDAQAPVFGHNKDRRKKLAGVILDPDDAIINRFFIYDGGTFDRPYEFSTRDDALKYHRKKTSTHSRMLFESIEQFKSALTRSAKDKYNEVLARIRWNIDSSRIGIFSDTFEARCIAQYYSERLLARLKQSFAELGKDWDDLYQVPIIYYLPNNIKNWTSYTDAARQQDIKEACSIFNDVSNRNERIKAGDGEFLIILPNPDTVLKTLEADNHHPFIQMLANEDFQLLSAVFRRAAIKESLSDYLNTYLRIHVMNHANCNQLLSRLSSITLYRAAETGYIDIVNALLSVSHIRKEINNTKDSEGRTALYIAAQIGHLEIVKNLIENGADVNQACKDGATPLYVVAENGHLEIVKSLIKSGADVNLASKDGTTPLFIAVQNGHLEVIKCLIENGANVNQARKDGTMPLHIAAENGHLEIVKSLIKSGANVNQGRKSGATPLYIAAQNGHLEVIKCLIENGANVNQAREDGAAPLYGAAYSDHLEVVKILLENGVNVNQACKDGATPLYGAAYSGHLEVVKILLENGANINLAHKDGVTPLQVAAKNGHHAIVKIIAAESLMRYIKNSDIDSRGYMRYLSFGGLFGYSKDQKLKAALALLNVVNGSNDSKTLDEHVNILNDGDLKQIYQPCKRSFLA